MTATLLDFALYAVALFILFITPGPVWVAVLARTMAGGFNAAWPLALGVACGDVVWPLVAILGVSWLVSEFTSFLTILKWIAVAMFLIMGFLVIRNAGKAIGQDSRLTRPGVWAGFAAGCVAILANPKAGLFYMGLLPGFFDLSQITTPDVVVILVLSVIIPLLGNLTVAALVDRARRLLTTPSALRRLNLSAGVMLIVVGLLIALT